MTDEFNSIKEDFKKVIIYSQNISNPKVDELFEKWLNAKRDFIEAFGGKLIYEVPQKVSITLNEEEKAQRAKDFFSMIYNQYENFDLYDFLQDQKEGFFNNLTSSDYYYRDQKIPKGMKIIKAFKFFESDPNTLEELQNIASMFIQENKIDGTLCFSVHPLDFLSISENNHNWRSCHALDGDYRGGNLSYMVDSCTIICYLKSRKMEVLPHFPEDVLWNSKKWRVLLFFSNNWDMLFAGRQYPFFSSSAINYVKNEALPDTFGEWTSWQDQKYKSFSDNDVYFKFESSYIPMGKKLIPMDELIVDNPGSLQFNDLLKSSCYDPIYAFKRIEKNSFFGRYKKIKVSTKSRFNIGGACNCLRCGEKEITLSERMQCVFCEADYGDLEEDIIDVCPVCGQRFVLEEGSYLSLTEEVICQECAKTEIARCENCGETGLKNTFWFFEKDTNHRFDVLCNYCHTLEEDK